MDTKFRPHECCGPMPITFEYVGVVVSHPIEDGTEILLVELHRQDCPEYTEHAPEKPHWLHPDPRRQPRGVM